MKDKKIFAIASITALVALTAVTVFGANELKINDSTKLSNNQEFQDTYEYDNYNSYSSLETAKINGNVQEITTNLEPNTFPAIVVQKGIPVKWTMVADETNLSYCNNQIVIPTFNMEQNINVGENVMQFTPTETGVIPYSCWMGMVSSSIVVVDDINNYDKTEIETQLAQIPKTNCCGGGRSSR